MFGRLTVIERLDGGRNIVRCTCGNEFFRHTQDLHRAKYNMCKSCKHNLTPDEKRTEKNQWVLVTKCKQIKKKIGYSRSRVEVKYSVEEREKRKKVMTFLQQLKNVYKENNQNKVNLKMSTLQDAFRKWDNVRNAI